MGLAVLATTRSTAHREAIARAGAAAHVLTSPDDPELAANIDAECGLIATFPPDGHSDAAFAPLARQAGAAAYVSSTGVYGDTRGVITDHTPTAPDSPRTARRLEAEAHWREAGATVLRVAAIYGPGRGQHQRVREGSARIVGDGQHFVSRMHVEDLAHAVLLSVQQRLGPQTYVLADDVPARQGEVIRFLAARMGLAVPAAVDLENAPETLRHDRQVDPTRFKQVTGFTPRYPSYREGFEACLRAEASTQGPQG